MRLYIAEINWLLFLNARREQNNKISCNKGHRAVLFTYKLKSIGNIFLSLNK